jgi:hypothetical protein
VVCSSSEPSPCNTGFTLDALFWDSRVKSLQDSGLPGGSKCSDFLTQRPVVFLSCLMAVARGSIQPFWIRRQATETQRKPHPLAFSFLPRPYSSDTPRDKTNKQTKNTQVEIFLLRRHPETVTPYLEYFLMQYTYQVPSSIINFFSSL